MPINIVTRCLSQANSLGVCAKMSLGSYHVKGIPPQFLNSHASQFVPSSFISSALERTQGLIPQSQLTTKNMMHLVSTFQITTTETLITLASTKWVV